MKAKSVYVVKGGAQDSANPHRWYHHFEQGGIVVQSGDDKESYEGLHRKDSKQIRQFVYRHDVEFIGKV